MRAGEALILGFLGLASVGCPPAPGVGASPPARADPVNSPQPQPVGSLAPEPSAVDPSSPSSGWKTYSHPIGLRFSYPPGWQAQETDTGVLLSPPDPATRDGEGQEAYVVGGTPAEGIVQADDPRVLAFVEGELQQMLPFVRRVGGGTPLSGARHLTVAFSYQGTAPTGVAIRANVYAAIIDGLGMILFAIGEEGAVARREAAIQEVVRTFDRGQIQSDPRLVGTWRYTGHSFSGAGGSTSERTLTFHADGSCSDSSMLMAGMEHRTQGGDAFARTQANSGNAGRGPGRWSAGKGRLIVVWPGGSEDCAYEVGGGALTLTPSGGKPKLYEWVP